MIPVTKPFLPPQKEYNEYLTEIWQRNWLTNMGPLAAELESSLQDNLNVNKALFVTNGTVALQMAIKALELKGEIITTPFSFIATTSCIVWEGCTPIFVDIDEKSLNIDVSKIEDSITENTSAILATHVYGNPCDVEAIEKIALKHKLKVIYDGAHAFGVNLNGRSIFTYGDISICSLHATKLYHSIEGGIIVTEQPELIKKLESIRNFGFKGPESFDELGLNGKNSEFHAAMGLLNLRFINEIIWKRKLIAQRYDNQLEGVRIRRPEWASGSINNNAYYPVIFNEEKLMHRCINELKSNEIHTRRYFFPSLASSLPYLNSQHLNVTDDISSKVLCLPLFHDLTFEEVDLICMLIKNVNDH